MSWRVLSKNINTKTGEYLLTLIHPDYPKYSENINITKEKLKFVEVNLDTLFGYFQCQVFPWSEIIINGEKKGVTPLQNPIRLNEGKYNLVLSENRALAVKEWYVKNGIDFRRIKIKGLGEANPIGDNKTEIGREMNRRIEIIKIN